MHGKVWPILATVGLFLIVLSLVWMTGNPNDQEIAVSPDEPIDGPDYGSTPILQLNSEQHAAAITRAAITADGSRFVTASRDNTIKIWRTADRRVIRTIRAPISDAYFSNPGSNYLWAIDIKPDGSEIAAAGQVDDDGTFRVMIFDPVSGNINHSPLTVNGFVADIAYSLDGTLLAAGIFNDADDPDNGLWVWSTEDFSVVYRDTEYGRDSDRGGRINGIAFNRDGSLITTSYDKGIRRYADVRAQTPPLLVRQEQGGWPYDLDISPDGKTVVIGSLNNLSGNEAAKLGVYDSETLEELAILDVDDLPDGRGGSVSAKAAIGVSYSADGAYIYAGLFANERGSQDEKVRRWLTGDVSEAYVDYDTCSDQNTLQILRHQQKGAIFLNAVLPCTTFVDDNGDVVDRVRSLLYPIDIEPLPDVDPGEMLVSETGDTVFLRRGGASKGLFVDLKSRRFDPDFEPSEEQLRGWSGYQISGDGVSVRDWANTQTPVFGHAEDPLPITTHTEEGSRYSNNYSYAVDVSAKNGFAVLGTSYFLAKYSNADEADWRVELPALIMRVNLTPSENAVVTYSADGVMRWHNASNGAVYMSLLIDERAERWLLWTPDGPYDSAGGDDMVIWHKNNGRDLAPSWNGLSRYRRTFFDKNEIDERIDEMITGTSRRGNRPVPRLSDPSVNLAEIIGSQAPPTTQVLNAGIGSVTETGILMEIEFQVLNDGESPVEEYRILIDGRTIIPPTPVAPSSGIISASVPVMASDRHVSISSRHVLGV